jgi:hypothetical protein
MGDSREVDSSHALALVPVPLGPGAMGAPMPAEGEESRRLENRRGTSTRLRETMNMMKRGRV